MSNCLILTLLKYFILELTYLCFLDAFRMHDLNFGFEWSFPFKIDWMDSREEINGTSLYEKPLWKEQSVSQCSYSYDKTEMLFSMKTELMTELPFAFICVKTQKILTVISKQN